MTLQTIMQYLYKQYARMYCMFLLFILLRKLQKMAGVEAVRRNSGGWTDEEQENDQQYQQVNVDMRQRREDMEHRLAANDWCQCGECWPPGYAASIFDLKCCHEIQEAQTVCQEVAEGTAPHKCITLHPGFYFYCLDRRFLENTYHLHRITDHEDRRTRPDERMRYAAYKSFTTWVHGKMGRHRRAEIPMCVTKKIREKYSSPTGDYTGFKEVDLDQL